VNPTVQLIEEMTDRALGRTDAPVLLSHATERATVYVHLEALARNSNIAEMPTPTGRNRFMKRLVLRLSGFAFVRQQAANHAVIGALHAVLGELDATQLQLEHERRRSIAAIAAFEHRLIERTQQQRDLHSVAIDRISDLASTVDKLQPTAEALATATAEREALSAEVAATLEQHRQTTAELSETVEKQRRGLADLMAEATVEATRRQVLERELSLVKRHQVDPGSEIRTAPDETTGALPPFDLLELYERFEASFRPAGDDLTARFEHYLADLSHLSDDRLPVLDIGTGRGDFLTVLTNAKIPCRGIDLNPEAVLAAQQSGLSVERADAFEYLHSLPNESLGAVTAFHVVEHVPPAQLIQLIDQIVRVLAPGGVLILETPNPTNLVVGASSFYHDPTHERPVTPDYLAFLVQDRGLVNAETRFLHPLPEFDQIAPLEAELGGRSLQLLLDDVRWALKGPQDYAIVARRPSTK
jgi:SAM-dependent methyltransferase